MSQGVDTALTGEIGLSTSRDKSLWRAGSLFQTLQCVYTGPAILHLGIYPADIASRVHKYT